MPACSKGNLPYNQTPTLGEIKPHFRAFPGISECDKGSGGVPGASDGLSELHQCSGPRRLSARRAEVRSEGLRGAWAGAPSGWSADVVGAAYGTDRSVHRPRFPRG